MRYIPHLQSSDCNAGDAAKNPESVNATDTRLGLLCSLFGRKSSAISEKCLTNSCAKPKY